MEMERWALSFLLLCRLYERRAGGTCTYHSLTRLGVVRCLTSGVI